MIAEFYTRKLMKVVVLHNYMLEKYNTNPASNLIFSTIFSYTFSYSTESILLFPCRSITLL